MERAPLGVAVIGAGYWGPNLVRNFYASEEWSVRCIVERDRPRLERLRRLYPAVAGHEEIESALRDPRRTTTIMDEHLGIAEALRDGDLPRALHAVQTHLASTVRAMGLAVL